MVTRLEAYLNVPHTRVHLVESQVCVLLPHLKRSLHGLNHLLRGQVIVGELGHSPGQLLLVPPVPDVEVLHLAPAVPPRQHVHDGAAGSVDAGHGVIIQLASQVQTIVGLEHGDGVGHLACELGKGSFINIDY